MEMKCLISNLAILASFWWIELCVSQQPSSTTPLPEFCEVPDHFTGVFYSLESTEGQNDLITTINSRGIEVSGGIFDGRCKQYQEIDGTRDALGHFDARILFYEVGKCYRCYEIRYRTPNVLQVKYTTCDTQSSGMTSMDEVCGQISPGAGLLTLFKTEVETINCKQTFEGVWQFSYEVDLGGGGICESQYSVVTACQEPGSPYVDNEVFTMKFAKCPEVTGSSNNNIRFQCMGSWRDEFGNIFSALKDLGEETNRDKYRCMLTRDDQQRSDNRKYHSLSKWAQCSTLKSPYEGPYRLLLYPVVYSNQFVEPSCNLPRNFTGTWFTTGEFDTDVTINDTHIYFKTKLEEFTYKETYFTCQQTRDSRFLMTAITVGKCEIDYICFDFMPRHHNVIRWRMSRPFRLIASELDQVNFLDRKFRQACSWSSFTIDRNEIDWTYDVMLLNPPAPVNCPIGGRYSFKQYGDSAEQYETRIRGITTRPRHMIDCYEYVTEFKSCEENPKKIYIDAEYCDTVDHTGRPIGEYDEPDRELNCVGHWMEDMKSYLITYDEEDATTPFRCWVYERLDWRDMIISRSTRAQCGKNQTARSMRPSEGASLHLVLKESERLFDTCPQRYDTGADPYIKLSKIWVVGSGAAIPCSSLIFLAFVLVATSLLRL